jgi:hypothetical protein
MIIVLWTVTALIGTLFSAITAVDYAFRGWRMHQSPLDGSTRRYFLVQAGGKTLREALRCLASAGLLGIGLLTLASGRAETAVSFWVLILFFANWTLAVNAVLERLADRQADAYMKTGLTSDRTPGEG